MSLVGALNVTAMATSLGQKIRHLRDGMSYTRLAKAVGVSTNTIRDIEADRTGAPGFLLVRRLAAHFDVSIDWLTDDAADLPPPPSQSQRVEDVVRQALDSAGLLGQLTDDERQLIARFRSLPEPAAREALGYLRGLTDAGFSAEEKADADQFRRRIVDSLRRADHLHRGRPPERSDDAKAG